MLQPPRDAGPAPTPPTACDQCGAPMKLVRVVPHPEKPGDLQVYECTACELPMVQYMPR